MMSTLLLIVLTVYLVKIILFRIGFARANALAQSEDRPTVSVIVAARNEEENIDACLEALAGQDYPRNLHELIIINDQSTDSTAERLAAWQDRVVNLRVLETDGSVYGLRGKANAVTQAIEASSGEIIVTTDADCVVSPTWISDVISRYDAQTGSVCGFTLIRHSNIFSGMQTLDWAYLMTLASGSVGFGFPLSAVGNNMSFRRKAYDEVGGYANVGFSVTEDFLLFKAIAYKSSWRVRYPMIASSIVWSQPCKNIRELYLQKKRWGKGGVRIHPTGFIVMAVGWLMNAGILLLPMLGVPLHIALLCVGGKFLGDAFLLDAPLSRLKKRSLFKYFFFYELYYLIYVTIIPFVAFLSREILWKGRKLKP